MHILIDITAIIVLYISRKLFHVFSDYENLQRGVYLTSLAIMLSNGIFKLNKKNTLKISTKYILIFLHLVLWDTIICSSILFEHLGQVWSIHISYMVAPGLFSVLLYIWLEKNSPTSKKLNMYTAPYTICQILHIICIITNYVLGCVCIFFFATTTLYYGLIINLCILTIVEILFTYRSQLWFHKKAFINKIQLCLYVNDLDSLTNPKKNFLIDLNLFLDSYIVRRFGYEDIQKILYKQLIKFGKSHATAKNVVNIFTDNINKKLMRFMFDYWYVPSRILRKFRYRQHLILQPREV